MGACLGTNRGDPDDPNSGYGSRHNSASVRKNHPLCHDPVKWKSDVPLTEGQLRSKRDEFWDTAPAFEGSKEIWDALKAAAHALEIADYELAQAILDGAGISVPNGSLTESYDELGTRYQVPLYCLSYPINLVKDGSGSESSSTEIIIESVSTGKEITLKMRLSHNSPDIKLPLLTSDFILIAKKKLQSLTGIDSSSQRWFFGGKLLSDKSRLDDIQIQHGFVVQVVVVADQNK